MTSQVVAMTEQARPGGENLTGVWQGLYSYSSGQSISFVATLIDSGASFSGSIHEPSIFGDTIYATLSGTRQGSAVSFLKTYEKSAGPQYASSIQYEGALNGDATEIEGRWTIRAVFGVSGKFLMIRSAGKAAEIEQKASERV
jgi:hypothetical protein